MRLDAVQAASELSGGGRVAVSEQPVPPAQEVLVRPRHVSPARVPADVRQATGAGTPAPAEDAVQARDRVELSQPKLPVERNIVYKVDQVSHELYFQIVDSRSGKVVSQVPPEAVLAEERHITQLLDNLQKVREQEQQQNHSAAKPRTERSGNRS